MISRLGISSTISSAFAMAKRNMPRPVITAIALGALAFSTAAFLYMRKNSENTASKVTHSVKNSPDWPYPKSLIETLDKHNIFISSLPIIQISQEQESRGHGYIHLSQSVMKGAPIARLQLPSGRLAMAFNVVTKSNESLGHHVKTLKNSQFAQMSLQNYESVLTVFNRDPQYPALWKTSTDPVCGEAWNRLIEIPTGLGSGDNFDSKALSVLLSKQHPLVEVGPPRALHQ